MRQILLLLIFAVAISGGTVGILYQDGIGGMAKPEDKVQEEYIPPDRGEDIEEAMTTETDSAADMQDASVSTDEAAYTTTDSATSVEQAYDEASDPATDGAAVTEDKPDLTVDEVNRKLGALEEGSSVLNESVEPDSDDTATEDETKKDKKSKKDNKEKKGKKDTED